MKKDRKTWQITMIFALILNIGIFVGAASAQFSIGSDAVTGSSAQDVDMTWSGRVDDTVHIRVRGRTAITRTIAGRRTTGINYNFRDSLPTNRTVYVNVRKRDGRGDVRIIQQPSNRNSHTAVIEIRDSSGGADFYRLELSWGGRFDNDDEYRPGNPNFSGNAEMTWQGRVDDRVQVRVRNRLATVRTLSGRRTTDIRSNFRSALPSNNVIVTVRKLDGRGSVRVIEQPRRSNGYSAVIEIRDSSGGTDFYSFELNWNRGFGNNPIFPGNNRGGSMSWSGSVDDTVRVRVSGRSARTITLRGQATRGVNYNFNETLPRRSTYVRVNKRDGRGSVRIIQQPSSRNGYTAIVEIRDSRGGRDNYRFELEW